MITLEEAQELHEIVGYIALTMRERLDISKGMKDDVSRALEIASLIVYDLDPDNRTDES
jgi:hypothetical protein